MYIKSRKEIMKLTKALIYNCIFVEDSKILKS